MREQRKSLLALLLQWDSESGALLDGAAIFCSDVGSFWEHLQLLGCIYGQYCSLDPCLCLDVGEVSRHCYTATLVKPWWVWWTLPQGPPSPWRQCLIDGCHGAEGQIGNKERGVAPWHMPGIHHHGGAEGIEREGGLGRREMWGECDLL